jgi:hypothetical protein
MLPSAGIKIDKYPEERWAVTGQAMAETASVYLLENGAGETVIVAEDLDLLADKGHRYSNLETYLRADDGAFLPEEPILLISTIRISRP